MVLVLRQMSAPIIVRKLLNSAKAAGRWGLGRGALASPPFSVTSSGIKLQTNSVILFGFRAVLALTVVDLPMLLARSRRFHWTIRKWLLHEMPVQSSKMYRRRLPEDRR